MLISSLVLHGRGSMLCGPARGSGSGLWGPGRARKCCIIAKLDINAFVDPLVQPCYQHVDAHQ